MQPRVRGIHHVTAIAGDPQRNLDFYAGVLGLKLVKRTVNFDDPGSYHLYYGDEAGRPGTVPTFFPWPGARRGAHGTAQATATAFSVPAASLPAWRERLAAVGAAVEAPKRRFDDELLTLLDPDGLKLELVASAEGGDAGTDPGATETSPAAPRGFHGVTLRERDAGRTAGFLAEVMGLRLAAEDGPRARFAVADEAPGRWLDVVADPEGARGSIAVGCVHHVAFRVADEEEQLAWRARLLDAGLHVSPVMDRCYFRSIYFREPGGVLFEIATDGPGFTADEELERLGTALKLPPWLEEARPRIEAALPRLELHTRPTDRARTGPRP